MKHKELYFGLKHFFKSLVKVTRVNNLINYFQDYKEYK